MGVRSEVTKIWRKVGETGTEKSNCSVSEHEVTCVIWRGEGGI